MTKTDRHRTALTCMARGSHASGCFRWRCFPHVPAIAACIGYGSGTCHLVIWQCGHFRFLHVSGSHWTMCRAPVVPHVYFLLAHVLCCGWVTCHFFIGPCVVFLLVHVAVIYSTTCHGAVHPRFIFWFGHVAWWLPSTCQIFISPCVMPLLFHVSCTGSFTCRIFIWSHGLPRFYHMPNNQFIIKVIQDHHCCTDWLHNYLTMST